MTTPLVIVGAGGHARTVAEAALLAGLTVLGFVDRTADLAGTTMPNLPVLGDESALDSLDCDDWVAVVAVGENVARKAIVDRLAKRGVRFGCVVHPSASVSPSAQFGEGCVILAGAVIGNAARVGAHNIVNTLASVDHDCVLENYVHISPGAHLAGSCTVGSEAHVGIGANVIPGCSIGARTVIGAGAVVIDDVPADVVAVGIPAKVRA